MGEKIENSPLGLNEAQWKFINSVVQEGLWNGRGEDYGLTTEEAGQVGMVIQSTRWGFLYPRNWKE